MGFKVGDRVEVMSPPPNTENQKDQIGPGVVIEVELNGAYGETHHVRLDSGEDWFYGKDQLRPLGTPKPSIQVGDQVRLTGVVVARRLDDDPPWVVAQIQGYRGGNMDVTVAPDALEVIRQPFKRGEVVYSIGTSNSEPRTVVRDEEEGRVLLARHLSGTYVLEWKADLYERRP